MFKVSIGKDELIDLLESNFGNVYEQMSGEEDTILEVKNDGIKVVFTIGKDGE